MNPPSSLECQHDHPAPTMAMPIHSRMAGRSFRNSTSKQHHEQEAKLVHRRDLGSITNFQRSEVTHTHEAPVASPDSTRNNQVREGRLKGFDHLPAKQTNAPSTPSMTTVRISVARSESTPCKPSFAKMAVRAANTADKIAHRNQLEVVSMRH